MVDLTLSVIVLLTLTGGGLIVLRRIIRPPYGSRLEIALLGCALGYGICAYIFLLVGMLYLYYPLTAWILLFCTAVVLIPYSWRILSRLEVVKTDQEDARFSLLGIFVLLVLLCFIWINFVNSAVPTMSHDTLREYFLYPKTWIREHGQTGDFTRYFSDNVTLIPGLISTLGMLLNGEVTAQMLVGFLMGVLCMLAVYRLARKYFPRGLALLAATIFYSSRIVIWISPSGKINLCLGFFEVLLLLAFFRWLDEEAGDRKRGWLILMALLGGFALNVHTGAILSIGVLVLLLITNMLFVQKMRVRLVMGRAGLFFAVLVLIGSPLYVKNFILIGNPFFPKLTGIFGGSHIITNVAFANLPVCQGLTGYFRIFWVNTMEAWRNVSQPPSPLLLALVPGLFLIRKPEKKILVMIAYCFLFSVVWYVTAQRNRYALSAIALLSICAAYVLYACTGKGKAILSLVIPLAVLFSFRESLKASVKAYSSDREKILCALNLSSKEDYLETESRRHPMIPNYALCRFINERLPNDVRIFGVHDEYMLRIDKPYVSARFPLGEELMRTKSEEEVLRRLKEEGFTHVHYNEMYVSQINSWFWKMSGWSNFFPADNPFSRRDFRSKYFRLLYQDGNEYLYEIVYPSQ